MTIEVPKSGWFITIIVGINERIIGNIIDWNLCIWRLWSDRYLARANTVNTFENSLGWIIKGKPKSNHLCVPAYLGFKKGKNTNIMPKK